MIPASRLVPAPRAGVLLVLTLIAMGAHAADTPARTAAATLPSAANASPQSSNPERLARGKYLVLTAGCNDCHTPWTMTEKGIGPDWSRMLSGHPENLIMPPPPKLPDGPWLMIAGVTNTAWAGPWGVSFTANLTPDPETGLGNWTVQNFKDTIRTGRHMGRGRRILPPMPIPMYQNFTDSDLELIFEYLQSIPVVKNRVPEPYPPPEPPAAAATAQH